MRRRTINCGDRFGRLTVVCESDPHTQPSGKRVRVWECVCDCGVTVKPIQSNLTCGTSTACGNQTCRVNVPNIIHNDHKTRLYQCWASMKHRAKMRGDECPIHDEWHDYEAFRDWSLDNGYKNSLMLCRNGDVGGYTPDNCRWDTARSNVIEAHAKMYRLTDPIGNTHIVYNLMDFCIDKDISCTGLYKVSSGVRKHHKGWKCELIKEDVEYGNG